MRYSKKEQIYICFEGLDGGGKTSVIEQLITKYSDRGVPLTVMPEFPPELPSLEIFNALDNSLFVAEHFYKGAIPAFFYLIYARALCIQKVLDHKGIILIDRYIHSMVMYQGYFVYQDKRDFNSKKLFALIYDLFDLLQLPLPSLTFIFDAPINILIERLAQREKRKISDNEVKILREFQSAYREFSQTDDETTLLVDASRSLNEVTDEVFGVIKNHWESQSPNGTYSS